MLECTNFRVIDDHVYADFYEDNNYVGQFGAEIDHVENTLDIKNEVFNMFRKEYLRNTSKTNKICHLKLIK